MSKKFQIISLIIVTVIALVTWVIINAATSGQSADDQSPTQTQQP